MYMGNLVSAFVPQHWSRLPLAHLPPCCTRSGRIRTIMWWRSESRFVRMPSSSWCAVLLGPQMGVLEWWRWEKTAKQNTSYSEECKTKGSLNTGLRNKWAMCSFFGVGASETSENNKVYCAIKKVHLKALGKKMNRDDTNPFLVAGSPIWPGKAASWLIQVFMQRSLLCVKLKL